MRAEILAWLGAVGAHPALVLAIVFATACGESLALIGTVVPAGLVMFAAGALIGAGALDGWTTVLVAAAGAIVGDGVSYEIGRRFHGEIAAWATRVGRASAYARGEQFVHRHGAMSIALARFLAPVRAVVPVVVGWMRMPRRRFYPVNVASALAWAPAHIAPGIAFGASAALAEAVSARLAVIFVVIAALIAAVWFGVRVAATRGVPLVLRAASAAGRGFARRWPGAAEFVLSRLRRVPTAVAALAVLFVASIWLFAGVLEDIISNDPLMRADTAVYTFLQALRTTPVDGVMTALTVLNGRDTGLVVAAAFLVWLVIHRCWRTAVWWLVAVGIAVVLVPGIDGASNGALPLAWQPGSPHAPLPDSDAAFGILAYGFIGWVLARGRSAVWNTGVATAVALWIVLAGFARLYLGQAWLSGLLGGWSLGLAWFAVLAGAYAYGRIRDNVEPRGALVAVTVVLATAGVWTVPQQWRADREARLQARAVVAMTVDEWRSGGWQQVPMRRTEISGDREEFLPLQWRAASDALDTHLAHAGWESAPAWSARTALRWLLPQAPADSLPVLPRYSQGAGTHRVFVRADPAQPGTRLVLRLWRYRYVLQDAHGTRPLWYGALYRETLRRPAHLLTIARTTTIDRAPDIAAALSVDAPVVHPPAGAADVPADVLLVSTPDN
ncbi:VTT domain-containing protein [Burkholderia guangdongensis]|uniref:VTT domain-containing protein n=1 Tax=Burkholderia guangdongensis TaxID=1792500 RepID=UPI0015CEEB74|nr:VTT domain-containing protein [Burkholderia guangdongensis]